MKSISISPIEKVCFVALLITFSRRFFIAFFEYSVCKKTEIAVIRMAIIVKRTTIVFRILEFIVTMNSYYNTKTPGYMILKVKEAV